MANDFGVITNEFRSKGSKGAAGIVKAQVQYARMMGDHGSLPNRSIRATAHSDHAQSCKHRGQVMESIGPKNMS